MANVGQAILTVRGALALADASRTGKNIKPKYYKVSNQDIALDPTMTDLSGTWRQADISGYFPISDNTVEFLIDIAPENAIDYGKTFGLYLEDNTLFMIAKPPYPFPPALRQTLKVQLVYQNVNNIVNFQYIPFYETEQDLSLLYTTAIFQKITNDVLNKIENHEMAIEALFQNDNQIRYDLQVERNRNDTQDNTLNELVNNDLSETVLLTDIYQKLLSLENDIQNVKLLNEALINEIKRIKAKINL